jgi:hypothetical protein
MAGDGELNAHKRQPGDIPVVDKSLASAKKNSSSRNMNRSGHPDRRPQ